LERTAMHVSLSAASALRHFALAAPNLRLSAAAQRAR
jgi:hypothetical protein